MKGKKRKGADEPKQPKPKVLKPKPKDKPDTVGWIGPVSPRGRARKARLKEAASSRIHFVKCYLKGFISSPAAGPAADPSGSSPAADPPGPSGSSPAASPAADPFDSSQAAEDPSDSSSSNKRTPSDIGSGLADERAFLFDPATQMGMGLDPGAIQAVSAASGMWRADGLLQGFYRSKLTRSQVQHDSGLIQARHNTQRWNDSIKLQLQHLAAATPSGTSLVAIQRHVAVTLATWDAMWGEYLHPKWAEQRMRLHGAQEKVLERYFMKVGVPKGRGEGAGPQAEDLHTCDLLGAHVPSSAKDVMRFVCALCAMQLEEEAASVSQQEWGTRKQLVVFFGNAGIGTRGGWGATAVLQACRKVVERPNSGKPTDRVPGKVVTVDEFRTSRVSSVLNSPQPCEEELDSSKPTRLEGWKPKPGQVQDRLLRSAWSKRFEAPVRGLMWCPWLAQATPGDLGKWVDRDCNAALNLSGQGRASGAHWSCAEQRMRLHGAQEKVLERYFMKVGVPKGRGEGAGPQAEDLPTCDLLGAHVLSSAKDVMRFVCALCAMQLEEEAASVSQQEWGTRKQLVVFFGNAGIGTRGGWGAKAVLQACRKVVERPNSGKPTDRVPGKVVTVDEFRTSRVSSVLNSPQPCEEELDSSKPTRLEGWKPKPGQVQDRLLRSAWSKRFEAPLEVEAAYVSERRLGTRKQLVVALALPALAHGPASPTKLPSMRTAALAGRCLGATFSRRASVTAHSTKAQMSTTAAPSKHWLLTYTYVEGIVEKRGPYRAAHLAGAQEQVGAGLSRDALPRPCLAREQADAGKLMMAGAVGEPPSGATFVWSPAASEEDIRRFVQSDVYVTAGLVTAWSIAPFAVVVKGA
ncbi:hypothetical protein QJQ45_025425 [Haematococcus lacustris]|nr:hypothetical protein QJQ45_025425 [Haematococcus lacustris]